MTTPAIEAENLSKRFVIRSERRTRLKERFVRGRAPDAKEFWALRNATFSVPRGASLGLIGQNGSGKSTALKVLTGIYRPTSGSVRVNGSVSALLEVGAGFHPELTGRENIRLNATILGFSNREIDLMMDRIIEFADIGDHIDAPIKHYSSGMYVRLGFAVAVMVRPEILLVDEVIAVGDEEFQRKCYDYLYELRRAGTSMIIVSHGMGQIADLCDEAVWLQSGEVQAIGPARRITQAYVDSVNAREATRSAQPDDGSSAPAQPGPEAAQDAPLRLGSGEVRITGIATASRGGESGSVVVAGDPVTFSIAYESSGALDDVVFGLGFLHESGVFTAGPNSGESGGWSLAPGPGRVEFHVDSLLLQPGEFSVTGAVVSRGHTYDYAERLAELRVRSTGNDEPGLVRMPGAWTHIPQPIPTS